MSAIKVVVVDDHQIVRDGIKALFLTEYKINVTGEAADYEGLMKVLEKHIPDVIVLDISLPGKSGVEIAEILKKDYPDIKILMLSSKTEEENIINSIHAGANGFLPKDTSKEEFIEAITLINNNEDYFGEKLSRIIYSSYIKHLKTKDEKATPENTLSEREIETLKLLSDGLSSKEIASKLCISPRTVESHKANILSKLNLKTSADLIKYAIKNGIVEL